MVFRMNDMEALIFKLSDHVGKGHASLTDYLIEEIHKQAIILERKYNTAPDDKKDESR